MNLYFDASALAKFVIIEAESKALRDYLAQSQAPCLTSRIAVTEVGIATARRFGAVAPHVDASHPGELRLPKFTAQTLPVKGIVLDAAVGLGAAHRLRTLDAIHVATAQALGASLEKIITYDARMITACRALGLPVVSPT